MLKGSTSVTGYKKLKKATRSFIFEQMAKGMDLLEISELYPNKLKDPSIAYKAAIDDEEFNRQLSDAYAMMYMHRLDKMNKIANTPARDLYPELVSINEKTGEVKWQEANDMKKQLLKTLEHGCKMAPIFTQRFKNVQQIESKVQQSNTVLAINWCDLPKESILIEGIQVID